ncbi:MAG: glycoside hydrolase family 25 protein [Lachnospiraceae bacterium]|nr:glycoside hydrolase family 25 protein [Lachnospiraceae bacterium]MBQ8947919.1 glycoside hydrolase family 25 protein [Lachnospiraceae bacterium]
MGITMFALIMAVVVLTNWDTVKRKLGIRSRNEVTVAAEDPEFTGGQVGDDLTAFMKDENFFDKKQYTPGVRVENGIKVNVMMDSVGQDLRIMVIDALGNLAIGAPFEAEIENTGRYVDEDRDGIIYVEHLREGEYYVRLSEREGYIVPQTKTMIKISKTLEYKALSDIAYLILTEDEVDITADDTETNTALAEADGTEHTAVDYYDAAGKIGIDVSRYNKEIDWEKVADDGIEYAIIRCGYRGSSSGSLVLDSYFKDNCLGAIKAGIPIGVYFFSQAVNETEAIEEASMVIEECKLYKIDLPIFIDSESAGGRGRADNLSKDDRTAVTKAFCETITNSGYEAGVYASRNWWNKRLDADKLTAYHAWLAEYTDEPGYDGYYDYWQYTSKGTVKGIETRVDLNVRYR